jgi:branched-chain amino acid transport system substrate-binding protein
MKTKRYLILLAIICLLFVAVGLLFRLSTSAGPREEISSIGLIAPLTGPGAGFGLPSLRSAEMAVEEINKNGVVVKGVTYRFKLIPEDDLYRADQAVDRLKKLIDRDRVKIVLGSLGSASSLAEGPICAANKVLHLTDGLDENIISSSNTYSFMMGVLQRLSQPGFIEFLAKRFTNIHKLTLIGVNDATGQSALRVALPEVKKRGWEATTEVFERGIVEFGPICGKVAGSKPDLVLLVSPAPGDARKIVKGLRELGYKGPVCHVGGFGAFAELYKVVGDDIGVVYGVQGVGEKPYANDEYVKFYTEYIKRYGTEAWSTMTFIFYSWPKIYAQAVERAQSLDPTVIRDLLATPGKEWYHLIGGKSYCITDQIAKDKELGSNRYFNCVWQVGTWDNAAKKEVNVAWQYPYGWPGGEIPK